jgi:hypothetical protein
MGRQYTPVDSMATWVTCRSRSQSPKARISAVTVPKVRVCERMLPSGSVIITQATTLAL